MSQHSLDIQTTNTSKNFHYTAFNLFQDNDLKRKFSDPNQKQLNIEKSLNRLKRKSLLRYKNVGKETT